MRTRLAPWLVPLVVGGVGCADPDISSDRGEPRGECQAVTTTFQGATREHVAECSGLSYPMSPPVFGEHYPIWAAYRSYDFPIPLGYLVHDLEHGAVVVFYDCPEGCADEVSEVEDFIAALPPDPRCTPFGVEHQVILVPRPGLGSRWAASAWGVSISADCFDAALFRDFYDAHLGHGPEDLCNDGTAFTSNPCE
jgi:hypothetical protein